MNSKQNTEKKLSPKDKIFALSKENDKLRSDLLHAANAKTLTERNRILQPYKTNLHIGRPKGSKKFTDQELIEFYLTVERGMKSLPSFPSVRSFFISAIPYSRSYNPGGIKNDKVFRYQSGLGNLLRALQRCYKAGKDLYFARGLATKNIC